MRITYVITRADAIGGAQTHVLHLGTELARLGHHPFVITGTGAVFTEQLQQAGIEYVSLPHLERRLNPLSDLRALRSLKQAIEGSPPDILSTHSSKAGVLGRIVGRRLRIPTLFTAHGWAFAEGVPLLRQIAFRQIERLVAPLAARIVTVCDADRQLALHHKVTPPERLVTIRNGVPDISPSLIANPVRERCDLITVARLEPPKDLDLLLHALAQLPEEPSWRLRVVGDGPLQPAFERTAAALGIDNQVDFLGQRRDVAEQLAKHDLFVLPSRWEGFPRTILEAMRAGLPVIASDVGGVREAVDSGTTGFVVPGGGTDGWLDPVSTLIADPALRGRMGAAGRQRYLENFTLNRMLRETLELYRQLPVPNPFMGNGKSSR